MKTIILTGGIGSGKSTVSAILKELGAVIVEVDKVSHEIINPGTPAWQEVVDAFGRNILMPDRTIDRKKLAAAVFHNAEALDKLNGITHPRVDAEMESIIRRSRQQSVKVLSIEVALITGANWNNLADYFWIVKAPQDVILKRLRERGLSEAESRARMAFQPPVEDRLKDKVVFINNAGTREQLKAKVNQLWQEMLE